MNIQSRRRSKRNKKLFYSLFSLALLSSSPEACEAFVPSGIHSASQHSNLLKRYNSNIEESGSNSDASSSAPPPLFADATSETTQGSQTDSLFAGETFTQSSQFGDVVSLGSKPSSASPLFPQEDLTSSTNNNETEELLQSRRNTNTGVAVLSVMLACVNYFWQFTHPISEIQLLAQMQSNSQSITTLGNNGKPTVVDFWAPWCENCKQMAPTLYQVEQEFARDVNFVMVNGDDPNAWPLIEVFGVDAIPHMALVESDGTVDTALIGKVPKTWLEQDLKTLVENSSTESTAVSGKTLPYQMLDVFANRPEARRVQIIQKE